MYIRYAGKVGISGLVGEIDNCKIKTIFFVINSGTEMTIDALCIDVNFDI